MFVVVKCANIEEVSGFFKYYFLGKNDRPLSIQIIDSRGNLFTKGNEYQLALNARLPEEFFDEYANHVGS